MSDVSLRNDELVKDRNKSIVGIQKEADNTIDVLILGDSLSYSAVSPLQMWNQNGITAYVCGQSGQKLSEAYYVLEEALEYQDPKVVLLETNMLFREQKEVFDLQTTLAEKGSSLLPILRYHDIWKSFVVGRRYGEERYKGFLFREAVKPYTKGEYMHRSKKRKKLSKGVRYYMDKIIDLCNEKNIELLLVATPSPENYSYRTYNTLQEYSNTPGLNAQGW